MGKKSGTFLIVLFVLIGVLFLNRKAGTSFPNSIVPLPTSVGQLVMDRNNIPQVSVVATGLDTPWAIAFLPDKSMLVTERKGTVRLINSNGELDPVPVATVPDVKEIGEGGLLGIATHPDFLSNQFVYLYYTYSNDGSNTLNRVVRMRLEDEQLGEMTVIVDRIPGASNHNGGRLKFGPDKFLYITTGDAEKPSQAQDKNTLGGKILRVTDEGKAAPGNPFNNLIFSYGHRNVQGIAWDAAGMAWATEHGRSGVVSGLDELNLIESGRNYGWPDIEGDKTRGGMVTAKRNSGALNTWAPSGDAFVGNVLFFGGLRGARLYAAVIKDNQVVDLKEYFANQYGRIREVVAGPDGMVYITTSNKDGRGAPGPDDDRVIRINPTKL